MQPEFNKLQTDSTFPNINDVDVYKFDNELDYSRFNATQMHIQICNVPWDVGEAHVGNRSISGIGNVVYFGSKEKRDAWFEAIPNEKCFRFDTRYKQLHRQLYIDVPLPFDVAARFNYVRVTYEPVANEGSLLQYETLTGKRDWFWFAREVEFVAPNTTRIHLLDDAFQTWIYDVNISGMMLERGHAPMFKTKADTYLQNPLANNDGLLCEDVNFGEAEVVTHIDALALNSGDMWACIATSAYPGGDWGSKAEDDWKVPGIAFYSNNGVPSVYVFAMEPSDLSSFMGYISNNIPQFKQTVQGIFFAPKNLVTVSSTFQFGNVTCSHLTSTRKTLDLTVLNKSIFGYDSKYADIAKLYTSPYAHIEITDESGNVDVIKIENTSGNIDVSVALSLAFPFITIDSHLLGTGGNASASVTFRNITSRSFNISGTWYETLRSWNVPTFAITLAPTTEYDYATHFDREQAKVDYNTAYTNTEAAASTEKANTATIAQASKTNADRSADTAVTNTGLETTRNTAITTRSNSSAGYDTNLVNNLSTASQAWEAGYTNDTTNNEVNAEYASAAIGAAGGIASGIATGGLMGAISGAIGGACSVASTAVAANLKETQASATNALSENKVTSTNLNNTQRTTNQNSANEDNTKSTNKALTGITANNAATEKENASTTQSAQNAAAEATYSTTEANATRERTRAEKQVSNSKKQAALRQPSIFGTFANGQSATTKPIGLFANIVTQSKNAISSAGDEFLRYGYMYEKQWAFDGNWNIGKYFTYWKLRDFWVSDLQVPDLYMDKLRFFLFGGVTIWSKPEYIGKVSIYDNFN